MDHLGLSGWLSILYYFALGIAFIILVLNLIGLKRLDQFPLAKKWPKVSVLVPARNEEDNIRTCVQSLLLQDYPDYEVIVLNDESTDNTGAILAQLCKEFPNLKVIKGKPLTPGWLGKNWACHQLSESSKGEFILFTDADTFHHPLTLKEGVSALIAQNADLLTAIPFEELGSWGERILLPHLFFSTLVFMPISIAHRLKNQFLCFSIGQFMFFKRSSYLQIGGYQGIKGIPLEDLILGRLIKNAGLRWRMVDGGLRIKCRMYHSFGETWKGLSRFLFLGYTHGFLQLIPSWAWTSLTFLGPIVALALKVTGVIHNLSYFSIGVALVLDLVIWAVAYWRLRFPILLSILYPVTFLLNFAATLHSAYLTMTGRTTWKGRPLVKTEV